MHVKKSEEKTYKDYGISDTTWESMKQFFLKTSVPRLIEKKRQAAIEKESMSKAGEPV